MKIQSPKFKVQSCWRWMAALAVIFVISADALAETILLKDAIVHTVSGKTLSPGWVLIQDGKIQGVIDASGPVDFKYPTSTVVVDLKNLHLYPGLIALNTALGLSEISGVRSTRDTTEVGDYVPDVQSWIAVNPDSELIPVARANGITHIQPAPQGGIVAGQSGLVVLDGWTMEQMAYKKPVALHLYWPSMELDTTSKDKFKDKSKWKSPEDQAKERQNKLKQLEDFFDEARAYAQARQVAGKNGAAEPALNPSWEAMLPFVRGELPIMIHAGEVRQIKAAVKWAESNKYKMILAGASDAWSVAELLATKKIPVVYEDTFAQPARDFESYDVHYKAPELLRKAGVTFAFGMGSTTFDAALIKNLPYSAAQAVGFGLPREDALKALTLVPAQMLGVADRLGSIEPGKDATLFASDGEILDIRASVKRMWIAGKEINLDTRHTRLYQKYKNRPQGN
jgi:imidazolonepropionase-like amidohydrolase